MTKVDKNGHPTQHKVVKVEGYLGLKKVEMEEAGVGDIVSISGIPEIMIGDTLCGPKHIVQLPPIKIAEPTVSVEMMVNNGPFVGKDGKHVTMNKIRRPTDSRKKGQYFPKNRRKFRDDAARVCGRGENYTWQCLSKQ